MVCNGFTGSLDWKHIISAGFRFFCLHPMVRTANSPLCKAFPSVKVTCHRCVYWPDLLALYCPLSLCCNPRKGHQWSLTTLSTHTLDRWVSVASLYCTQLSFNLIWFFIRFNPSPQFSTIAKYVLPIQNAKFKDVCTAPMCPPLLEV